MATFIFTLLFGFTVQAQPVVRNIVEVPTFMLFQCDNNGRLKVFSQADRGVYDVVYTDALRGIRGTFQYTPNTSGGGVYDHGFFPGPPNAIGIFQFDSQSMIVSMNMITWGAQCWPIRVIDINEY